ncbi:MFS transporter [Rhodococcus pyridinivorans]|uniref:MFS transporter n=1 Tax=Rhodococcus pyridinivorans TaxID=103816 RepID=UPI00344AC5F6
MLPAPGAKGGRDRRHRTDRPPSVRVHHPPHAAVDDATREIGAAIGVAITGSVLAAAYGHGIDPVAPMIPEPARAAVQDSLAAAIQVAEHAGPQGEQLAELAQNAFLDGLQQASWAVAAILLVGALISAFWPPRRS